MTIDDFRYMWRGKPREALANHHAHLLTSIDQRGQGKNRAILLLHGFSSSPAVYRHLLPKLPPYDAVICPALPGHGESLAAFSLTRARDWVATAEEACAEMIHAYQRVDVLGLSLGGLLACHLSQQYNLHHLYLLAPALRLKLNIRLALISAKILYKLGFRYLRNRAGNICSELYSELAYRQLPLTAVIEILTLVNEFKFTPPPCPTDLFLGTADEVVDSEQVADLFKGKDPCTIHWLPHSAHVLPLDHDLNEIIACLNQHW